MANINLFQIDESKEERFVKVLQNESFVKIGDKHFDKIKGNMNAEQIARLSEILSKM